MAVAAATSSQAALVLPARYRASGQAFQLNFGEYAAARGIEACQALTSLSRRRCHHLHGSLKPHTEVTQCT